MDIGKGFRIGERLLAWGTTIDDAADALGVKRDEGRGSRWRRIELSCGPTWGFETICAEMTAYGGDRPVTALKYELGVRAGETPPDPATWMTPLMAALGTPHEAEGRDLPVHADPSASVGFYASWPCGDQSVGLSIYGAARPVDFGLAAGCIWLNWSINAAAQPFLEEWRARASALATEASVHSGLVSYSLSEPPNPLVGLHADANRDSMNALGSPQLLPTPRSIAAALGKRGIGFWRSKDQRRWYASTFWDTAAFGTGETIGIDWYDVAPAKGGGFSEIAMDGWSVRDLHGSRAIADAVAALRTIPGVTVRKVDSYDC